MNYFKTFKKQEELFAKEINKIGNIVTATKEEDINEHWDVKLETTFDVKSIKKIRRKDESTNEDFHWVEIKNVNGDKGWLYGKANYFCFETDDYWIVVEKVDLQSFISEKCKKKEWCAVPEVNKLFTRKNRKDILVLVKTIDLMYIAERIIKKTVV